MSKSRERQNVQVLGEGKEQRLGGEERGTRNSEEPAVQDGGVGERGGSLRELRGSGRGEGMTRG